MTDPTTTPHALTPKPGDPNDDVGAAVGLVAAYRDPSRAETWHLPDAPVRHDEARLALEGAVYPGGEAYRRMVRYVEEREVAEAELTRQRDQLAATLDCGHPARCADKGGACRWCAEVGGYADTLGDVALAIGLPLDADHDEVIDAANALWESRGRAVDDARAAYLARDAMARAVREALGIAERADLSTPEQVTMMVQALRKGARMEETP